MMLGLNRPKVFAVPIITSIIQTLVCVAHSYLGSFISYRYSLTTLEILDRPLSTLLINFSESSNTSKGQKGTITNLGGYHSHEGVPIYHEICHRGCPISRGDQNFTTSGHNCHWLSGGSSHGLFCMT